MTAAKSKFDDFARRWLLQRKDELAGYMVNAILKGPLKRVPPRLRKLAMALRTIRADEPLPDTRIVRALAGPAIKRRRIR